MEKQRGSSSFLRSTTHQLYCCPFSTSETMTSIVQESAKLPAAADVAAKEQPQTTAEENPIQDEAAAIASAATTKKVTPSKDTTAAAASIGAAEQQQELLSPYDRLIQTLRQLRDAARPKMYDIWNFTDDMEAFLHKAGVLPDDMDDMEDLSREEVQAAYDKLTEVQVMNDLTFAVLPELVGTWKDKLFKEIMTADPRSNINGDEEDDDEEEDWMYMTCANTASSMYMVQVILERLAYASKEVVKAMKACCRNDKNGNVTTTGGKEAAAASKVFSVAIATVLAIDAVDHWRCDTEDPDSVNDILQRIGKLLQDVFWFTNDELGIDALSRKGLLRKMDDLERQWQENALDMGYTIVKPMKYKCPKNGQGMGRSLEEDNTSANPRPAKKAKTGAAATTTTTPVAKPASSGMKSLTNYFSSNTKKAPAPQAASGNTSCNTVATTPTASPQPSLIHYFSDLPKDKLNLRVKTMIQLQITSLDDPKKRDYVVVSGATDMKKLNHLVAYVTDCTSNYHYHSQKGTSLPGSYFELSMDGYKTCWIGGNKELKQAGRNDAILDKSVKVVQIFQGLTCRADGTMMYDSELAKSIIANDQSLVFCIDHKQRFAVSVMAIAPVKCGKGSYKAPLPKLVKFRDNQNKTGFGRSFKQCKKVMQGDRSDPKSICIYDLSPEDHFQHWALPICQLDKTKGFGSVYGEGDYPLYKDFSMADVATAGPPSSYET